MLNYIIPHKNDLSRRNFYAIIIRLDFARLCAAKPALNRLSRCSSSGRALALGACRKILFRFRKAPESPLLLRKSVSKAVKKREIARFSFRGFPHDHMKDHNDDHMKNGGRKSKFHISGCGPMVRRYIWDVDFAGSIPVTPTISSIHNGLEL